jgi:hypothetical protein
MEYVDLFYQNYDSLTAFTFKASTKIQPPVLSKPRKNVNAQVKLQKLSEDPEFKDMVELKRRSQD